MEAVFGENICDSAGGVNMNRAEYMRELAYLLQDLPDGEKDVARQERKARRAAKDEGDDVEWIDVNTYRVARKRPISE